MDADQTPTPMELLVNDLKSIPTMIVMDGETGMTLTHVLEVHWDYVGETLKAAERHHVRVVSQNQEEAILSLGHRSAMLTSYAPAHDTLTLVANDLIELDSLLDGGLAGLFASGQELPAHLRGDMSRRPIPMRANITGVCDEDTIAWQVVSRSIDAYWGTPFGQPSLPSGPASEVLAGLMNDIDNQGYSSILNWQQVVDKVQAVSVNVDLIAGAKALAGPGKIRLPKGHSDGFGSISR